MNTTSRILIAGVDTLLGRAIHRTLRAEGCTASDDADVDFTDPIAVESYFSRARPEYVFMAAGRQGGIEANRLHPATLMLDNLLTISHTLNAAHRHGVKKLLYVASACVYPRLAPQPMRTESLMTGPFEPTNDAYASAKMAGIKLCQAFRAEHGANFIAAIPANMFGPDDHFDPRESHVIGALMHRMTEARESGADSITIWGTGRARREFVYADDIARACTFAMREYDEAEPINLGGGEDVSIAELAEILCEVVGYHGRLEFDVTKPDGMPLKSLDSDVLFRLGWRPQVPFRTALVRTYEAFCAARSGARIDRSDR